MVIPTFSGEMLKDELNAKHRIDVGLKLIIRVVVENIIFHISVKQIIHR